MGFALKFLLVCAGIGAGFGTCIAITTLAEKVPEEDAKEVLEVAFDTAAKVAPSILK